MSVHEEGGSKTTISYRIFFIVTFQSLFFCLNDFLTDQVGGLGLTGICHFFINYTTVCSVEDS